MVISQTRAFCAPVDSSASESSDRRSTKPPSDASGSRSSYRARRTRARPGSRGARRLPRLLLAQVLEVAGLLHHLLDARRRCRPSTSGCAPTIDLDERLSAACARASAPVRRARAGPWPRASRRRPPVEQAGGHQRRRSAPAVMGSAASSASITTLPMPRVGTLTTRRKLTSSCGLMISLRYASASLTSLRS